MVKVEMKSKTLAIALTFAFLVLASAQVGLAMAQTGDNTIQTTVSFALTAEEVLFSGVLIGCIARTGVAWYQHVETEPVFQKRYWGSLVASVIGAFIVAATIFNQLTIPANTTSLLSQFLIAVLFGWGANDMLNKLVVDNFPDNTASTSPQPKT